jgi:hypothetical protein
MFRQAFFEFLEQQIAGEQIKGAQAISRSPLRTDKALLGTDGISGMMMHVTGPWSWWTVWRFEALLYTSHFYNTFKYLRLK